MGNLWDISTGGGRENDASALLSDLTLETTASEAAGGLHALQKKTLLSLMATGEFYSFCLDLRNQSLIVSDSIEAILGHKSHSASLQSFWQHVHPEDRRWIIRFEKATSDFFLRLPKEKWTRYKVKYDFRIRKTDGTYIKVLHQWVGFLLPEEKNFGFIIGIHLDISHLKSNDGMSLSFVGLGGEPSHVNVMVKKPQDSMIDKLTKRELEIISLLADGSSSKMIADKLFLSIETVNTHRRRILKKTDTKNVAQLIRLGVVQGLFP